MYVKHNDSSNLNINSTILSPPTKIYVGQDGAIRTPTMVSIPPIRRKAARQSGRGVEYEDTDSEHDDTDEETMDYSVHEEHNHIFDVHKVKSVWFAYNLYKIENDLFYDDSIAKNTV